MSLTPEQKAARKGKLTASMIGMLMRGDETEIYNLWRLVSGDPSYEEPDFSDNWPVQLGVASEAINIEWYRKKIGPVSRCGEVVTHANGWAACTLDGWDVDNAIPIQAKHVIQYKKIGDVLDFYAPQHHWEMFVNKTKRIGSTVIIGSLEPVVNFVPYDEEYGAAIYKRAESFMNCVQTMTPPVKLPELKAPVRPEDYRTESMLGNNEFAAFAADWLENKEANEKFEASKIGIKSLIAPDVGLAYGYGIKAKRDKRGSITIKEGEPNE